MSKLRKQFSWDAALQRGDGIEGAFRGYVRSMMSEEEAADAATKEAVELAMSGKGGNSEVIEGKDGRARIVVSALGEGFTMPEDEGLTPEDIKHKKDALWIASGAKRQGDAVLAGRAVEAALKIQDPKARQMVTAKLREDLARFQAVERLKPRFRGTEYILALFATCPQLSNICEFVDGNVRFV